MYRLLSIMEDILKSEFLVKSAIKIAQKGDWDRVNDEFEDLETLVVTVGKDK